MMLPLVLALYAAAAWAQSPAAGPSTAQDARSTPRGSVFGFLDAARQGDYRRASLFLQLSAARRDRDGAELARQLKLVLDRKLRTDPAVLSDSPDGDLVDGLPPNRELAGTVSLGGRPYDILLERATVEAGRQVWLFSAELIASLPALYANVGNRAIERHLPVALVENQFWDAALWQWLGLLIALLLSLPLGTLVSRVILRLLRPLAARTRWEADDQFLLAIARPLKWLLAVLVVRIGIGVVGPPLLLRTYLVRLLTAVAYFALAWLAMRTIDAFAAQVTSVMTRRQRATASSAVPLARRTAKVLAIVIAIIAILDAWGYNTTALLAGLGVGGLAVALAAQRTLENLFGGVSLISDKPVLVGDFCKFGDRTGTVEDIGLRSTRVRTLDRTVVSVPNGQFSSLQIENFARRDKFWFHPILGVRRDASPDQLRALLAEITSILKAHPKLEPGARVKLIAAGRESFDLEVFAYVQTRENDEFLELQQELLLRLLDAVHTAGTQLAMPTQLSFVSPDGATEPRPALSIAGPETPLPRDK